MSDLAKWKVHGPVETLRTEFATWDPGQEAWQPLQHCTVSSFRPDGTISASDFHNPDGSIAHSRWLYNDAGRLTETNSWLNDEPIDRALYFYDEAGRHVRTVQQSRDGVQTDLEICSYDADGKKTKVHFLFSRDANWECEAGNTCGASTGYGIEGTDTAYGAPGAATITTIYDDQNLPAKVLFHDADHRPLNYVIFTHDSAGRLSSEEMHQGERSPFQRIVDQASPERREEMAAMLKQVLGETFSNTAYVYDARGRLIERTHTMSSLGGDRTTYRYDDHDDPIEETTEHRNREASIGENGSVHYSSDTVTVQHNRLEYRYDEHGNWTERIVSFAPEPNSVFQRCNIERRAITYHA